MQNALTTLQWVAALVIALQAVDRLYQCQLLIKGDGTRDRVSKAMKGLAWGLMAAAAMGVLVAPLLRGVPLQGISRYLVDPAPGVAETCLFFGYAVLIVRSWVGDAMRCKRLRERAAYLKRTELKNKVATPTVPQPAPALAPVFHGEPQA